MITYTDESILDIGKVHRGKKLKDVPDSYFLWLWDQKWFVRKSNLGRYIESHMDAIKKNIANNKNLNR